MLNSPNARFNAAISARPAEVANPLSNAATPAIPAVPNVAGPATPATPATPAIQAAAPPAPTAPAQPPVNDWRTQMKSWIDARPQRPDGYEGGWGRSDAMQAWRDARPNRPEGSGRHWAGLGGGWGHRPSFNWRSHGPWGGQPGSGTPGGGTRPNISDFLSRLGNWRGQS